MGHALRCDVVRAHDALSFQVNASIHCQPAFTYYHVPLLNIFMWCIFVTLVTLSTYAFMFVCVVCVTKKHLFTHLPVKLLCEKDVYCSLIHRHAEMLTRSTSRTENTNPLITIHIIVPGVSGKSFEALR